MKIHYVVIFMMLLAGCGSSVTTGDEPGNTEKPDSERECPTYEVDGQQLDEVPEEELEMYDFHEEQLAEEMEHEGAKESIIVSKRSETFDALLEEEGITREELMTLGGRIIADTSIVIQLRDDLTEEKRKPLMNVIEQTREKYNEEAVIIDEVPISQQEKRNRMTEVMGALKNEESIREKLSSVGSCGGGSMDIEITTLEKLKGEEIDFLRSTFDFPVYTNVSAGDTSGYVTSVHKGRMLVDFTYFSDIPEGVEVGDYVSVTHGPVAESFPSQASAYKTEIRDVRQPEGAQMTDKDAVTEALKKSDKGHKNVTDVFFDEENGEWRVTISGGIGEDSNERIVTVTDE